ncbi:MAG TPA: NifU family protein [Acidimicrobiales bacterium]|nr:NifU family protein [Acidimicrobiales bacterium]
MPEAAVAAGEAVVGSDETAILREPPAGGPGERLSDEDKTERLAELTDLIDMVRPIIQQDGGDLVLISADVEAGLVELQLQGACSSCAVSATTLQAGVDRILKDRLPWVTEVTGGVDEDLDWEESAAMGRGGYVPKW